MLLDDRKKKLKKIDDERSVILAKLKSSKKDLNNLSSSHTEINDEDCLRCISSKTSLIKPKRF